jgi:hypothetical protein
MQNTPGSATNANTNEATSSTCPPMSALHEVSECAECARLKEVNAELLAACEAALAAAGAAAAPIANQLRAAIKKARGQ